MRKQIQTVASAIVLGLSAIPLQAVHADYHDHHHGHDRDRAILTFSTVGDSRQALFAKKYDVTQEIFKDANGNPVMPEQDTIWHQNTKAISRIVSEVEHQNSDLFFFNGDMIMGYGNTNVPADTSTVDSIVGSDLVREYKEYAFWRGIMAGMMEKGTYVVPVPGNHEMQCSTSKTTEGCTPDHDTTKFKGALVANENAWRANMGDLILDNERLKYMFGADAPNPANENVGDNGGFDNFTTDQSKLSYSFDMKNAHFVVIDTDPVGADAHAPVKWLAQDLAAAQARGMQHMFVFGHKPAFTYHFDPNDQTHRSGLDNHTDALDGATDPYKAENRDAFWSVIEQYGATYFCGHEHIYHMDKHGSAWQVLVGSGGSPFEAGVGLTTVNPKTDRDYAWATVKVLESGLVNVTIYGFDDKFGSTKILQSETF